MLKISEFSRLSQIPVKTLRYYDEIGLFVPARVDTWTGYRYYNADQLPRVRRLVQLKELGFSLQEIGRILDDNLSAAQIGQLVRRRHADLVEELAAGQLRLDRLEQWLDQLKQESTMREYVIETKTVPAVPVAYVRRIVPTHAELPSTLDEMFGSVFSFARRHDALGGPAYAVYYDEEWTGVDIDVAAAQQLSRPLPPTETIEVRELPAVATVACTTHFGPYRLLSHAYDATIQWAYANGWEVCGPAREVYLSGDSRGDQSDCVTEVQFPVRRVG